MNDWWSASKNFEAAFPPLHVCQHLNDKHDIWPHPCDTISLPPSCHISRLYPSYNRARNRGLTDDLLGTETREEVSFRIAVAIVDTTLVSLEEVARLAKLLTRLIAG